MSDVKRGFLITCVYDWVILGVILEIGMDESEILRKFVNGSFSCAYFMNVARELGQIKCGKLLKIYGILSKIKFVN